MNGMRKNWLAACLLSTSLITLGATTGCKKAPATQPVLNSDGTTSNPNGTVTVPPAAAPQAAAVNGTPAGTQAPPQQYAIRNQDGSITNPDGSVTYPAGSRVANRENAPAPAPVAPAPERAPVPVVTTSAPAPVYRSIPAGTRVVVRINETLSAHQNEVGNRWSGTLQRPLVYNGETVFPTGTSVSGEVVASKGRGRFKGAGDLGIELTSIGRERVESSEYERVAKGRGKRSAAFTGGGAGIGALIGGLAGGGKGALIGGLAGAGGGAAAGSYTGSTDVVIPAESVVTFTLRSTLTR